MRKCDVIVDKIIFHNQETAYAVFRGVVLKWSPRKRQFTPTKEVHTFVGYFFCLFNGDRFEVEVEETFNRAHGSQYLVVRSKRAEPGSLVEVRGFLLKNVKGMTPKRVERVLDKYGLDVMKAIKEDPSALDFLGLDPKETHRLHRAVLDNESFERTMGFLQKHDVDCRLAMPMYMKYGQSVETTIRNNPYTPFVDGLYDFKTADTLYFGLGKRADDPKRCLFVTYAALQMDAERNGNIFTRRDLAREKIQSLLDTSGRARSDGFPFTERDIDGAFTKLENSGFVVADNSFGFDAIYLKRNYLDERTVSDRIKVLMGAPKRVSYKTADINLFLDRYERNTGVSLAPAQKKAVFTALTSPITIISGGPGTGKTQTINTIMAAIHELSPSASIRAAAPTGKAAIRITELTGLPAATIHRMIGLGRYAGELKDGELICDAMFADEFSMADMHLCAKLLGAMNELGRVILVGDYNQLPSVGPGLVLRDFIASGVIPKVVLRDIFRQAGNSRIVTNAHRIINQTPGGNIRLKIANKPGEDFYYVGEDDPQAILKKLVASVRQMKDSYGYGLESVQVLSPVNFGDLGVERLNYVLQQYFNRSPAAIEFDEKEFRLGDKVVQTKNNYSLDVFNGEVGFVSDIAYMKDKALKVTYPDRDIWYPITALPELDLAYAMTVHKMQGSEYPVIIMPVHELQGQGLSKNVLYTALTRAKKMVVLIGSTAALSNGLRRETTIERESNLVGRLQAGAGAGKGQERGNHAGR